jgi:Tfp pilus assembly protein PilF
MKNLPITFLLILFSIASCVSPNKKSLENTQLGVLKHQFIISAPAQDSFEKGLLLLHSFEYDDARVAFQDAVKKDSTEVMAYWGEAMSHYKALWGLQNVDAGRAVIAKLGKTKEIRSSRAQDDLEKDFWTGVEILYGDGELFERNKAYANHMGTLYEKYKGNQEVAAFYALGLMWSVSGGRDPEIFDLSAKVVSGILEENPNHPGALHYLIHANDDPKYAQLAKIAADKYAKVAPDATHALHMPSHIYLALGMWNDVVASNEASYGASVANMERKGLTDDARGYHSYAWLHYGYLQQGRFQKAAQLLKDMQVYTERSPSQSSKSYLIKMQSAQVAETGKWLDEIAPLYVDYDDLGLSSKAELHFFKSMLASEKGDDRQIAHEIDLLDTQIKAAELIVSEEGIAMCSSGSTRYAPSRTDIVRANVITKQMNALIAVLNNDDMLTEKYFIEATNLEAQSEYSYGPPDITYPSFEQYGEWLLNKKRYDEALTQFDRSLATAKNRSKALQGKIKALMFLNREDEAREIKVIMSDFWKPDVQLAMN